MSTVDIDKQVREIITRLFTYGVDWTEYRDKGGPNGDHDVATYAAKIKTDFANEIANELVQLFAANTTHLKAELLAKMPNPDTRTPISDASMSAQNAHNDLLTEITKLIEEL